MKTVFVIQRPDGTPFQRDDAMGILATDSEAQAIRFANAREDDGAEYVRYTSQPPHHGLEQSAKDFRPKPCGFTRITDGRREIVIGTECPPNRSGGYSSPWAAVYDTPSVDGAIEVAMRVSRNSHD